MDYQDLLSGESIVFLDYEKIINKEREENNYEYDSK